PQENDHREGKARDQDARQGNAIDVGGKDGDLVDEVGRDLIHREPQEILDLAGEDDDPDAGGEAGDHRLGDIFDPGAEAGEPGDEQHDPGHEGRDHQAVIAMFGNHVEDHHHESAGGAADLDPAAAEGRD